MSESSNTPNTKEKPKKSWLNALGFTRKDWSVENVAPAEQISQADMYMYGAGMTTSASLLGLDRGKRSARSRQIIYQKWMDMEGAPIIASAIQLLVTSALGGHETSGDIVFVEESPKAKKDKRLKAIVEDIRSLTPLFNRVAYQMAYTGCVYGDSYARIYADEKRGVKDICNNEMVRPQLVQPFECGERTVGFAITIGKNNFERLTTLQMARLKMPRTQWIPQFGVVEKALKIAIAEDDYENLPIMPSMVGGSLLYKAEIPFDNFTASLLGLVGQRWIDSIDEQIVTVNLETMNKDQQTAYLNSMRSMLQRSKAYAEQAVNQGFPLLQKIRHIMPIFNEKQIATIQPPSGNGRTASITIDDVMVHARLLAGALGVDLSMLGFADQLSGGLGEGGFFRVSAQAAESARVIRVALEDFFNQVINIHTYYRYGIVFDPAERPWDISFFGSISALEAEKQRTRADSMNAGLLLVQAMQALKDMGANKEIMQNFLQKSMALDEDDAELYASIVEIKQEGEGGEMGGGFGEEPMPSAEENTEEKPHPNIRFNRKKKTEETNGEAPEETPAEGNPEEA